MKCLARSAGEFTQLVDCPLKTFLVVTSISADCDGMRCVEQQRASRVRSRAGHRSIDVVSRALSEVTRPRLFLP